MPQDREVTSSPSESRKNSKPVMEKRRRARINASLCELKSLLLEVMKKEGARHNKMEKADILEMTVKHLRQIQRQQFNVAATSDPSVVTRYQSGFAECAHEVTRYLATVDGVDGDLRARMLTHLATSIQGVMGATDATSQPGMMTTLTPQAGGVVSIAPNNVNANATVVTTTAGRPDDNNNMSNGMGMHIITSLPATSSSPPPTSPQVVTSAGSPQKIIGGVQLLPTRLPSGDMAFVLPSNIISGGQIPGYVIPVYSGAPTVVSAVTTQATSVTHNVNPQTIFTSGFPANAPETGNGQTTVLPVPLVLPSVTQMAPPPPSTSPETLATNLNTQSPTASQTTSQRTCDMTSPVKTECTGLSPDIGVGPEWSPRVREEGQMEVVREMKRSESVGLLEDGVWRPW